MDGEGVNWGVCWRHESERIHQKQSGEQKKAGWDTQLREAAGETEEIHGSQSKDLSLFILQASEVDQGD